MSSSGDGGLQFGVLGPLEVRRDDVPLLIEAPRQQALLSALLLHANHVVPVDQLIEYLWADQPPDTARNTVQTLVLRLRRLLEAAPGAAPAVVTRAPGYLIRVEPGRLDLHSFEELVREGRRAAEAGNMRAAAGVLRQALALWRGPALAAVRNLAPFRAEVVWLEERRLAALEERIAADLNLGRHGDLVGELQALVAQHPLSERLWGQLMLALFRSDRRAEALRAYHEVYHLLDGELGVPPGTALQRLHQQMLDGDQTLHLPAQTHEPVATLPAAPAKLVGRQRELAALQADVLSAGISRPIVLSGPGGIGKTALAVVLAHQLRNRFPDGQLFLDLRGLDDPLAPVEALRHLLRALDPAASAPADDSALAAAYRYHTGRRRLLVLLDNAADEAQVRPLVAGGNGCATLITSRRPLTALADASITILDVLPGPSALDLLAALIGTDRVAAAPDAAAAIISACGGLPLAIRLAAAKLAARPRWTLDDLAGRLAAEHQRLGLLSTGDVAIRSTIGLSYHGLSNPAQAALRMISAVGAAQVPHWLAARLAGLAEPSAQRVLDELVDAQLINSLGHGPGGHERYQIHDLVRLYAYERMSAEDPPDTVAAAIGRAATATIQLAAAGADQVHGDLSPGGPHWSKLRPATDPIAHPDPLAELTIDYTTAYSIVELACRAGHPRLAAQLAIPLAAVQERDGRISSWVASHELVLTSGGLDPATELVVVTSMGSALLANGQLTGAEDAFRRAATMAEQLGDEAAAAFAQVATGVALRYQMGSNDEAKQMLTAAVDRARSVDNPVTIAHGLRTLAMIAREEGHPARALELFDECLAVADFHMPVWYAVLHHDTALCHIDMGNLTRAQTALTDALDVFRRHSDLPWQAATLRSVARVQRAGGDLDAAVDSLRQSLNAFCALGDRRWQGYLLRDLAEVEYRRGHPAAATADLDEAERCMTDVGDDRGLAQVQAARQPHDRS